MAFRKMPPIHIMTVDFETRSCSDVRDVGAWRYAEDETTEILCLAYKLGDGPSKLWTPNLPFPQEIIDHIEGGGMFEAHNVQFERAIWYFILHLRCGIPMPKRWMDTLAVCAYRGLPLNLDKAGSALNLPIQKDKRGKYLLQRLSKPKRLLKKEVQEFEKQGLPRDEWPILYVEDFDLMEELYDYCLRDADTERGLSKTLGPLPTPEYRLWVLDQVINQRGVQLDIDGVKAALAITGQLDRQLTKELQEITDGAVESASQRDRMLNWLRENGLRIANLQKDTVEGYLEEKRHLDPKVARVLEIRQLLSRASAKKLVKMLETVCTDGRIRGLLQYHGAGTGRWAGRLVQPQNFPRGKPSIFEVSSIEELIDNIKIALEDIDEAIAILEVLYDDPMEAIATSLRGMFVSGPGKKLMVADFSAIEARVVMWVAGCDKAIEAFSKYDRGEGPDIYCVMAQELYERPINKKDDPEERQLGKITVLGCFGADTLVLTDSGPKAIVDVKTTDRVWDGVEWVHHDGLIDQGYREIIRLSDVAVTPEHEIWTGITWIPAVEVAQNENMRFRALEHALANLPSPEQHKTLRTSEKSPPYKTELQNWKNVYDIANAGPRNRFTIITEDGPLIVHNCGYQMGGEKLQFQAEKDYNLTLDLETCQWLVQTYREAYPEVKSLWYGLNDAAIDTVRTGRPHSYSCIQYEMVHDDAGAWLACILPNGRRLWYYDPIIEQVSTPWGIKDQLTYMGRDNKKGGSWGRIRTYGGMLTENVVQAISRDLMAEGMIRVEKKGYPIILTIHDEIVAEPDEGHGSLEEFNSLMAGPNPVWARGCPVTVEGWEGYRYKKA